MRLVGQLVFAATAMAASSGCDRHTRLSPRALAAEADANTRACVSQVMNLISLAFGSAFSAPVAAAEKPTT